MWPYWLVSNSLASSFMFNALLRSLNIRHFKATTFVLHIKDKTLQSSLLGVVVSHAEVKDSFGPQFFESFVHIGSHGIVVFVCLVAQAKHLETLRGGQ